MRYLLLTVLATVLICDGCSDGSSSNDDVITDSDSDADTDTDTDLDTDTDTDCTTGVCCDTTSSAYRLSTYPCNVTTLYDCTSTACGGDAQEQDTTQYCSGTSADCDGASVPGSWVVMEDCTTDALCDFDSADSWCTTCSFGCSAGACDACTPTWTEHTVDGTFEMALSVYVADMDGDGDMDVLGAANLASEVIWWENTAGDGTAWTEHMVDSYFNNARSVYAADLDGDGDMDAVGAASAADDITWWENTAGDGTAWSEHVVDGFFYGAMSAYAEDVDGDGDMDVLGAAGDDDDITWWENTAGDGTAWIEHTVDGAFDGAFSVYAADVDGDGDIDVLGAAVDADDIAWWENTAGDGTAWTEHTVDGEFDNAWSVYAADVDGDGDMDVLGAASGAYDITWWENTAGDGTAWTEHTVDGEFDGARCVFSADVDGDGDMDILGAAFLGDEITWWENTTGDGTAWTEHTVDGAFDGAWCVFSADVDGDGDMDILGAAQYADDITWWESDCIP